MSAFPFTKTRSQNEDLNNDVPYGLCPECDQPNTGENWCKECYSKKFQQNFNNWTSGNKDIDKFIQESQLNARNRFELLEWIPYNQLRQIDYLTDGESSTVYEAIWLDGWIMQWDYEKQDWKRVVDKQDYKETNIPNTEDSFNETYGYQVAIKSLESSSDNHEELLDEVSNYNLNNINVICYVNHLFTFILKYSANYIYNVSMKHCQIIHLLFRYLE
jgi:hypothetical protein